MGWSTEEAHFCVEAYFTYNCYQTVQRKYQEKMSCKKAPTISLIDAWVKEFKEFGSVESLDSKLCWSKQARKEENINAVRKSLVQNPKLSLRKRSKELGIPVTTLNRIIRKDLNLEVERSYTEENINTVGESEAQNPDDFLGSGENFIVLFGQPKEIRTEEHFDAVEKSLAQTLEKPSGSGEKVNSKLCWPKRGQAEEKINAVRNSLLQNPNKSLRKRSKELGISVTTLHRIIRKDLNLEVEQSCTEQNINTAGESIAQNPEQFLESGESINVVFDLPKETRTEENIDAVQKQLVPYIPENSLGSALSPCSKVIRPKRVRTEENITAVRKSLAENPEQSLRNRSQALGMSVATVHRILRMDLNVPVKKSRTRENVCVVGKLVAQNPEKSLVLGENLDVSFDQPKGARTEKNINAVRKSMAENPNKSVRQQSRDLGIPLTSLQRILKLDLNLKSKQSRTEANANAVWKSVAQNPEMSIRKRSQALGMSVSTVHRILKSDLNVPVKISRTTESVAQNPEKSLVSGENLNVSFYQPKVGARTEKNIDAVKKSVAENPNKSVRQRSKELGMSVTSLQRILKLDLNLKRKPSSTEANSDAVWKSVAQNPEMSIRKRSQALGMSVSMVHRILKKGMKL